MGTHNGKIIDPAHFLRNTKKQQVRNRRNQTGGQRYEYSYKSRNDVNGGRKSCSDFAIERGAKRCTHKKHWTVIAK